MSTSDPTDALAPASAERPYDVDGVRSRRRAVRWAVPFAALACSLLITLRTHLFFLLPYATPVSNDEGYLSAMALRMIRGHWLPYVDGVSQRGPLLYWLTTAVMRVGGMWSWVPMRLLGLTLSLTIVSLVFALATSLATPMAGALASMACTYFLTYELNPWDGVGVNGEPLAVAFALAACLVIVRAQRAPEGSVPWPKRRNALMATGLLIACAGLSKQMFLLHGVPIALWVLLGSLDGRAPTGRSALREIGWMALGFVAPYALVVAVYALSGHFGTFWYYYQRYGREIFMDPLTPEFVRDKVREQIDKYYLGIAGIAGLWFCAVGIALRTMLAANVTTGGEGRAVRPVALRLEPESHVALNLLLPGLGLATMRAPRRRVLGFAFIAFTAIALGVRAWLRHARGIGYSSRAVANDTLLWIALGVAAGLFAARTIVREDRGVRWMGLARLRAHALPWFAIAQCLCAFLGACFTFRFFPHYFVELFPFASVVIGCVVAEGFLRLATDDRPGLVASATVVVGGALLLLVASSALARNVRLRRETDRWYQNPMNDPIVRYVGDRTTAGQSIFVWGFRAETYLSSHRWPGSRYIYTVYPAGVVPWFQSTHEEEERRVVPGSRDELLRDLDTEQPELVIDAGRSMNGRYMYNYPQLRNYLDRNYCFMRYVDGEPVYRRRHGDRCPPADY